MVDLPDFWWGICGIIFVIIFVVTFRRSNHDNTPEWDKPEWHEKWKKEQEKQLEEERKRLITSKILVTEEQFNALSGVATKAQKVLNRICYNGDFIHDLHKKDNRTRILYDGKDMYTHFRHESLYDVLWVFDRLGCLCDHNAELSEMLKRCRIDFETIEGHCLLIISRAMSHIDSESPYEYFDYQRTVGDPESLFFKYRDVENSAFDTFVRYNPTIGQDDYKVCDLIGDFSDDDKLLYRDLMFRLAQTLAAILEAKAPLESDWIKGKIIDTERLERINDGYEVPLYRPTVTSDWNDDDDIDSDDDDDEYGFTDDFDSDYGQTETAEITYSFIGSDAPEDSFEMELSEKDAERLKEAEEKGEFLDSNFISENFRSIHRKILNGIREDLEAKSADPHDGMKEVHRPPAYHGWEKAHDSHQDLLDIFDSDDVEYEVDLY